MFDPDRHEPLGDLFWDDAAARAAIDEIVSDTQAAFDGDNFWPIHPLDRSDERPGILKALYYGAAGVIWALDHLDAAAPLGLDPEQTLGPLPFCLMQPLMTASAADPTNDTTRITSANRRIAVPPSPSPLPAPRKASRCT